MLHLKEQSEIQDYKSGYKIGIKAVLCFNMGKNAQDKFD
jgi:hypothetical protein